MMRIQKPLAPPPQVDPEFAPILDRLAALPSLHSTPLHELRRRNVPLAKDHDRLENIKNVTVEQDGLQVPVRIYKPVGERNRLVIFMNGGGFVFGGLDGHYDPLCRRLAEQASCTVIAVDYRLAPEDKFPAAADDVFAVLVWSAAHAGELAIDRDRIILAGASAGANLAASCALRAREQGGPAISGQLLFYPVLDSCVPDGGSYDRFGEGYYLTRADMVWFWEQYLLNREAGANPYASPLRAESFASLPPTLIFPAGLDPLRDEGEAYGERLLAAGVPTIVRTGEGLIHGFLGFETHRTDQILREAVDWIRRR